MIFPRFILKIERWKFNKDFGVYVSTLGQFKDRHKRNLAVLINQHGYCAVKTERGLIQAHRLVLFTWRPIPEAETLTVDHKNHNKRDNSLDNLEWVTREENIHRAARDYVVMSVDTGKYQYYIGKHIFSSIDEAYNFLKGTPNGKTIEKDKLTLIFDGLLREREKGNLRGCVKSYCGYNITVTERTV